MHAQHGAIDRPGYPQVVRVLHWIMACLVALQFGLIVIRATFQGEVPAVTSWAMTLHIHGGAMLFVATGLRLALHLRHPTRPVPGLTQAQMRVARMSHRALYAGLLLMPIARYTTLASLGNSVDLFGFISLPELPFSIALARAAQHLRTALAIALLAVIALHFTAALLHRRLFGAAVLHRMRPGRDQGS